MRRSWFELAILSWLVASFTHAWSSFKPNLGYGHRSLLGQATTNDRSPLHEQGDNEGKQKQVIEFKLYRSIAEIKPQEWNSCLNESSSPFLEHSWLLCLELSKCASHSSGWTPQHLGIVINGAEAGFVPMYMKSHSMGEFVFDHVFAEAAYSKFGVQYYPKLLIAVPFSPVTGQRIIWRKNTKNISSLNKAVGTFLREMAERNNLSSVHFNFVTESEAIDLGGDQLESNDRSFDVSKQILALLQANYLRRTSIQYHWRNSNPLMDGIPYETFDDYLACFKSKKRISIRRERQKVREEGVVIEPVVGRDILKHDGLVERMFEIYLSTVDKKSWGRQYLTLDFFRRLSKSEFVEYLVFMCARKSTESELVANDVFAGTINIVKNGIFYGRYWGCLPGQDVKNLHFECCYWAALEFCIKNKFSRMEPGAGGGDYKWARGFDPVIIHSVHYFCNPELRWGVRMYLEQETEQNLALTQILTKNSKVGAQTDTD